MKPALLLLAIVSWARPAFAGDESDAEMGRRVQALLRVHEADIFGCVQLNRAQPNGELLVRVFVGEDGRAERPEVLKDQSGAGAELGRCLVGKVRGWDLKSLGAAAGDQLVFPLAFQPSARRLLAHARPDSGELVSYDTVEGHPLAELDRVRTGDKSRKVALAQSENQSAVYVVRGSARVACGKEEKLAAGDLLWCTIAPDRLLVDANSEIITVEDLGSGVGHHYGAVVRANQPPALVIAGGKGTARLYLDKLPDAAMAVDTLTADAGVEIPPHRHDSDELLYVIAGKGVTTIGGDRFAVGPGDAIWIPKGEQHSLVVDEKLSALQVYVPNGPEQRFKPRGSR